jgi:transcription-repair coupling factor (superfamily II helicase)
MLVVITANPLDAQRLSDEIAWLAPGLRTHLLPDWETLPYDSFSPHQDLISERLSSLYAISRGEADIALVPASTALYRLAPPAFLAAYTFFLKQGSKLDVDGLRRQMTVAGYAHVTQVMSPGEYSVRGGLVDLFPMGAALPYRIDLFDDEIESIKTFDPDTQRTVFPVRDVRLLPAREFPMDETGRTRFRGRFRETFEGDPSRCTVTRTSPTASPRRASSTTCRCSSTRPPRSSTTCPTAARSCCTGTCRPPSRPSGRTPAAATSCWVATRPGRSWRRISSSCRKRPSSSPSRSASAWPCRPAPPAARRGAARRVRRAQGQRPAAPLQGLLRGFPGRVLVLAESAGRQQTIAEYFAEYALKPAPRRLRRLRGGRRPARAGHRPLAAGFVLPEAGLAVVTESELYAATARSRTRRDSRKAATMEGWLRDLSELKPGDPVVHSSHGIGRYMGLVHMDLGEGQTEFLHLEYANGDKLYVPVSQLHVITRYAGADPEAVHLHTLGSGQWEKAKKKAAQQVRDTAAELLALYAQRAARKGHQFDFKQHDLEAFADGFGFEETPTRWPPSRPWWPT